MLSPRRPFLVQSWPPPFTPQAPSCPVWPQTPPIWDTHCQPPFRRMKFGRAEVIALNDCITPARGKDFVRTLL